MGVEFDLREFGWIVFRILMIGIEPDHKLVPWHIASVSVAADVRRRTYARAAEAARTPKPAGLSGMASTRETSSSACSPLPLFPSTESGLSHWLVLLFG